MSNEEKLPEELDKLEIAPPLLQVKLMDEELPIILNPFYGKADSSALETQRSSDQHDKRASNCRKCRLRRRSESVLDDLRDGRLLCQDSNCGETASGTRLTPRIHRQPFKKTPPGGSNRKSLLREPMLRILQTYANPQSGARQKLFSTVPVASHTTTPNSERVDVEATQSTSEPITRSIVTDFRDLIAECQNLLDDNTSSSSSKFWNKRFTQNAANARVSFSHFQSSLMPKCGVAQSNGAAKSIGRAGDTSELQNNLPPNSIMPSTSVGVGSDCVIVTPRANTSCSQQAGSGAAAASSTCDDVTIDELASYFDTLVHIPKKMSTMAEMMYI